MAISSKEHLPHLDGIRGIAVLLVICCHAQVRFATFSLWKLGDWGWSGVDLFFVLSGFLITGILLDSRDSKTYFRSFYARRTLRILPLYYSLLLLSFGILPILSALGREMARSAGPLWLYVVFLQNVFPHARPPLLVVTWSLAVEEQFYILWPLLVFFLPVRWLKRLMLTLVLLIPVIRAIAFSAGVHPAYIYFNLFHLDGLALGSLGAILTRSDLGPAWMKRLGIAGIAAGVVTCVATGVPTAVGDIKNPLVYTGISLFFFGVLLVSLSVPFVQRFFVFSPLRFTGKISYCLYLVHYPILSALAAARKHSAGVLGNDVVFFLIAVAASYAVAITSWYVLEQPVLRLKRYFEYWREPQATTRAQAERTSPRASSAQSAEIAP